MAGKQSTGEWTTRPLTKSDYDYIVGVIDRWWGGPTSTLAHPSLFYELGKLARVVEHEGKPIGFLFGFVAGDGTTGYVHLVGIAPEHRRRGVASALYRAFEADCRAAGCRVLKALTNPGNDGSVRFHQRQGWKCEQVADYAGAGRTRLVFTKKLSGGGGSAKRVARRAAPATGKRGPATKREALPPTERSGRHSTKRPATR